MESNLQEKNVKLSSSKKVLIVALGLLFLIIAIIGQITYAILNYDKIYNGVYISNIYVGEMLKDEAVDFLSNNLDSNISNLNISITVESLTESFKYSDIEAYYDIAGAVDKAYEIGRSGSISERLRDILNTRVMGSKVPLTISYNEQKLKEHIQTLYDKTYVPAVKTDIIQRDDQLILRSGTSGKQIEKDDLQNKLSELIQKCNDISIEVPVQQIFPEEVSIEELYSKINIEPVNADVKVENGNVQILPHKRGRTIDKSYLIENFPSFSKEEGKEFLLPVEYKDPEITSERLQASLFRDTLSEYGTKFSTSTVNDANRAENIRKAVEVLNGLILSPGENFSFNKVVGPRTEEAGYKPANGYANGKVVQSFGGGICQASSTLYNSVLLADLKVTERVNHMFTVSYVPYGRDATVSYGEIDFQFVNSTKWPIKIEAWTTEDNMVFFRIKGTNENPGRTVEYTQNIIKTMDFPIHYIDDPELPEGTNIIKQYGSKGYVVETYKIVKENGNIISQNKIHTSVYNPLYQEVIRGTKKVDRANENNTDIQPGIPEENIPSIEIPHVTGIDDADNPPATLQDRIQEEIPAFETSELLEDTAELENTTENEPENQ
ncbi:MAG TPA: vanomycin resistance protein VanB [Clostridiaceae bacterium]|nr:vanomycin resistance protein VanB [Clostridiaceae bacterium]